MSPPEILGRARPRPKHKAAHNMPETELLAGDAFGLDSRTSAVALLRETLAIWLELMLPYFKETAESHWGDEWENECASLLSKDMEQRVRDGSGWDAYRIFSVLAKCPSIFLTKYDELPDSTREIYRQVSDLE